MDTSWQDRRASLSSLTFEDGQLRLPEILVIGNGTHKQGLFVGLYGGAIRHHLVLNRRNVIPSNNF